MSLITPLDKSVSANISVNLRLTLILAVPYSSFFNSKTNKIEIFFFKVFNDLCKMFCFFQICTVVSPA